MSLVKVFFVTLSTLIITGSIMALTFEIMAKLKSYSFTLPTPIGFMLYISPMLVLISIFAAMLTWFLNEF